ncbi:MAG: BMP family ABC transporter substrate-binding protein [Anaerolineae bacterium]
MYSSKAFSILLLIALLTMSLVAARQPTAVSLATTLPATVEDPQVFKVVFMLADSPTDNGWNAAHYRGITQLKTLGEVIESSGLSFKVRLADGRILDISVIEKVGYSDSDIERVLRSALEKGAQMVFGTWLDSRWALSRLAEERADVLFEHCSGYPMTKSNGRNLSTYFIKQEQGDYVAGYVVGRLGHNKIGLVGTHPIPEPVRGINGFTLGLQRGLQEAGHDPKDAEVRVVWINSWLDVQKEQLAADGLIAEGYKIIRQMADTPYSSQTACQEPDVMAVGYGTDVTPYAPCSLVTNEWNWGPYYVTRIQEALDGNWKPHDWWGGFEADAVVMAGWNEELVPAEVRAAAEQIITDIKAGFEPFCGPLSGTGLDPDNKEVRIEVPQGKCLTDMDLLTMQWFVDGVKGEYPSPPPEGHKLELKDAPTPTPTAAEQ